jgi:DNA-binding XRE family transcriptional regulator
VILKLTGQAMSSRTWTDAQKAKQSARASARWQAAVRAGPTSHPLARARALRDLSQRELGALAGVSSGTVSAIEQSGLGTTLQPRSKADPVVKVVGIAEPDRYTLQPINFGDVFALDFDQITAAYSTLGA